MLPSSARCKLSCGLTVARHVRNVIFLTNSPDHLCLGLPYFPHGLLNVFVAGVPESYLLGGALFDFSTGGDVGVDFILLLQTFQFPELVGSHAAILLVSAVVGLLGNANLADRIDPRRALPDKHLNLP